MGFFGKLIEQFVSGKIDDSVEAYNRKRANMSNSQTGTQVTSPVDSTYTSVKRRYSRDEKELKARIEEVLREDFAEYTMKSEVPASELRAEAGARDYSYGVYLDGALKAVIMIINNSNHYKRSDVVKAERAARSNGVAYMNVMSYMISDKNFIRNRLKERMGCN